MIRSDVAHKGAHDFVIAHTAVQPAEEQNELHGAGNDRGQDGEPGSRHGRLWDVKEAKEVNEVKERSASDSESFISFTSLISVISYAEFLKERPTVCEIRRTRREERRAWNPGRNRARRRSRRRCHAKRWRAHSTARRECQVCGRGDWSPRPKSRRGLAARPFAAEKRCWWRPTDSSALGRPARFPSGERARRPVRRSRRSCACAPGGSARTAGANRKRWPARPAIVRSPRLCPPG